jgi:hypothetical protein
VSQWFTFNCLAPSRPKANSRAKVVGRYDIAADVKKRISLRGAKTKYFHVKAFSNGCYLLEPRVLVPPEALSARTLRMVEASATHLQKGLASAPIDLKGRINGVRSFRVSLFESQPTLAAEPSRRKRAPA